MFCKNCGKQIPDGSKYCPSCGADQGYQATYVPKTTSYQDPNISKCSRRITRILACVGFVFIGGLHRFYVGKIGTGILWLLTGGLFGIGTLIDVIYIAYGSFTDSDGKPVKNWDRN